MKFIVTQLLAITSPRTKGINIGYLLKFIAMLLSMIIVYSVLFHIIMAYEQREFSWLTGFYWTFVVMSTLGFGDITFTSDLGKFFSIVVILSGVIFLMVMLPFTFIQFFYAPWLEAQKKERVPRRLPAGTKGHIILVGTSPLSLNLANELIAYGFSVVSLCDDPQTTLSLIEQGHNVIMGDYDNGQTYQNLCISQAALIITLDTEMRNTSITFTVREQDKHVPIMARAEHTDALDILYMAGCSKAIQLHKVLGEGLAKRILSARERSTVINRLKNLVIAEAAVINSSLVGKTLLNSGLRAATGINIIGIWERGLFQIPRPDTVFTQKTLLLLAGTEKQIQDFNKFVQENAPETKEKNNSILILGGGRVGRSAADYLQQHGRHCCIVERQASIKKTDLAYVLGDAADLDILEQAGIRTAPTVIITTHDDDINIYLTIYCRRLRPDIQIISRANFDRNVGILHSAGADVVLSLTSMMSNQIINQLSPGKLVMLNEGLNIFRTQTPQQLQGKQLHECGLRTETKCNLVAVQRGNESLVPPEPNHVFAADESLYLIGDSQAEKDFYAMYGKKDN